MPPVPVKLLILLFKFALMTLTTSTESTIAAVPRPFTSYLKLMLNIVAQIFSRNLHNFFFVETDSKIGLPWLKKC